MSNPRIIYSPRADATKGAEFSALANVYRFVLDCRTRKKAASESRPDDGTEIKEDSADVPIISD